MVGGGVLGVVALVLVAILSWPSAPALAPPRLSVSTNPDGAAVYLEGRSLGRTPISDLPLDAAIEQAILRIEKTGYASVETTLVAVAGASVSFDIPLVKQGDDLVPDHATLEISSTPGDARVLINGNELGNTDAAGQFSGVDVEPGGVLVEIFKEGYTPWSETVQVVAGENRPIDIVLERVPGVLPPVTMATLTLQAVPGGTVSVVGENCQLNVPCTVRSGDKRITFSYEGHTCTRTLRLNANAPRSLTCYFERTLNIQVRREDGSPIWATILVDGLEIGKYSDGRVKLKSGERRVEVQRTGYDVLTPQKTITVEPGFEERLTPPVVFRIREQ